jgi:hypothetical protein
MKKVADTNNPIRTPATHPGQDHKTNGKTEMISPTYPHHLNMPCYWHTASSVRYIGQSSAFGLAVQLYRLDLAAYHRVGHQRVSWRGARGEKERRFSYYMANHLIG